MTGADCTPPGIPRVAVDTDKGANRSDFASVGSKTGSVAPSFSVPVKEGGGLNRRVASGGGAAGTASASTCGPTASSGADTDAVAITVTEADVALRGAGFRACAAGAASTPDLPDSRLTTRSGGVRSCVIGVAGLAPAIDTVAARGTDAEPTGASEVAFTCEAAAEKTAGTTATAATAAIFAAATGNVPGAEAWSSLTDFLPREADDDAGARSSVSPWRACSSCAKSTTATADSPPWA